MSHNPQPVERQARRHAGPLIGMAVLVVLALGGLLWWLSWESAMAPGPTGDAQGAAAPAAATPDAAAPVAEDATLPLEQAPAGNAAPP